MCNQACIITSNQNSLVMKLKRKYLVLLPLAGVFLIPFSGCNKDEDSPGNTSEQSNTLVYEDQSLREEVSPNFYDNHIYRIELLGANKEREQLIGAALNKGVGEEFLLIEEAQKFFFNHTEVIMYSIPTIDPEQTLILYESKGLYQLGMVHLSPVEDGKMAISLKTLDDRDYFSLKLDDRMYMGELKVSENEEIKAFNQSVYSLTYMEESQDATLKGADAICCRKESSWKDCMNCTIDECGGSWLCKAAAIVMPAELVAGFAVSCIGAGPDARC
jgi:hypothetical protein